MNRTTTFETRSFDWTSFMPSKRPAVNRCGNYLLFGLGLRWRDDQIRRSRYVALGADWLVRIAAGYTHDTNADHASQPAFMRPNPMTLEQSSFVEITVFTFSVSVSQRNFSRRPLVRFFLNGRRVFWKGSGDADV